MERPWRDQESYPVIRLAQFLAGLSSHQDVWSEAGRALVTFFGADVAAFGARRDSGEIVVHDWAFSERDPRETGSNAVAPVGEAGLPAGSAGSDVKDAIGETLESGFLTSRFVAGPDPLSLVFLPISQDDQVTSVMLVGHRTNGPLPDALLDVYLAVAGLVGTSAARLASERELREHRRNLETLVTARTTELTATNAQLQREIAERARAEERVARLNHVLRAINNVDQLIVREKDRDRMVQGACDVLVEARGYHCAWIALFDEAGGLVEAVEAGLGESFSPLVRQLELGELPPCGRTALVQTGVVVIAGPSSACALCPLTGDHVNRVGMTVRLEHGGKIYGLLSAAIPPQLVADEGEQVLFQEVGGDIAFALHDIELEGKRDRAEGALRESQRQLATLMSNLPGMAYRCSNNADWTMEFVSDGCQELTGYRSDELVGNPMLPFSELIHPEDRSMVWNVVQEAIESRQSFRLTYRIHTASGAEKWVWEQGQGVFGADGAPVVLEGFIADITEQVQSEDVLRQREHDFVSLVENATDVIVRFDTELRHVYCNPAVEKQLGLSPETLMGRAPTDLPGPRQQSEFIEKSLRRAIDLEREIEVEQSFPTPDGLKIFQTRIVPERDSDGRIESLLAISRDVTERRRAQEALVQERALLRTVIDHLPDAVFVKDAERRVTLSNPADLALIGAGSEADVLGKIDFDLHPAASAARYQARDAAVLSSGEPMLNCEELLVDSNGRESWLLTSRLPLRDAGGQVTGLVGIGRDITERKAAETERERLLSQIRTQIRQVQQIVDTVPEGVLLLDEAGRVLLVNPAAERNLPVLIGPGEHPYQGRDGAQIHPYAAIPLTHLGDRSLAELISPPPEGLWHDVHAGGRIWEVVARPIESDPVPSGWVLVTRDVTQEREIQQRIGQQERLAAVGQLTAGIAHDFNNIMAVIVLYAQMMARSDTLSERDLERVVTINEQAHHAARLIQQMLDFSRRAMLQRQPMDLRPLFKEQVKLLERALPESIRVRFECEQGEFPVNADPTRMQQMLMNLAVNARDAMPEGGVLRVELAHVELADGSAPPLPKMAPGPWVRLTVSDTGTGMSDAAMAHLFEPFFTTKDVGQGSGLGLAQVYGIVGQHQGHIGVATQPNRGTTFTIYLPALQFSTPMPVADPLSTAPQGRGELVLLVEDNASVRSALAMGLEILNYRVLETADGVEALAVMEQRAAEISLVLSDAVMPEMGGPALVRTLRGRGWSLPVIILSGHPQEHSQEQLNAFSGVAWLSKPAEIGQLARAIARALQAGASP